MYCRSFLKQGDQVFVCDINDSHLQQFRQDYPQLHTFCCDLGQPKYVQAMFDTAVQQLGGLDILINNTGVSGPTVAAEELSFEEWTQVLNLNLNSTF